LAACQREGRLFFAQEVTDDVLAFVRAEPEIGGGVRAGNIVYETKIPFLTKEYLAETDPTLKRSYYCHCPWAREAIRSGEEVAPIFCNCSAGFHKKPWKPRWVEKSRWTCSNRCWRAPTAAGLPSTCRCDRREPMAIQQRPYDHASDYARISAFLIAHYRPGNLDGNWLEPAWEYIHFHPALEGDCLEKIGVWEDGGEIVAVAHPEWRLGEAFFQFHPAYRHLRAELLGYAEANLTGVSRQDGRRYLSAYVNDNDLEFPGTGAGARLRKRPR